MKIVGECDFAIQNSSTDQVGLMSKLQQGEEICDIISAKCNYLYTRMECCSVSCKVFPVSWK